MEFVIKTSWDSEPNHSDDHVKVSFEGSDHNNGLWMSVQAKFHDDPAPTANQGALWKLWVHEVIEVFILGDDDRYLEIEVGPHGHHLVLLLNGFRQIMVHSLELPNYEWNVDRINKSWTGRCFIPMEYFPKGARKINCYAVHGKGADRKYNSLFPVPHGLYSEPEFHRLEYFGDADFGQLLPGIGSMRSNLWHKHLGTSRVARKLSLRSTMYETNLFGQDD